MGFPTENWRGSACINRKFISYDGAAVALLSKTIPILLDEGDDALANILNYIWIDFYDFSKFSSVDLLAVSDHVSTFVISPIYGWIEHGIS